MTSSLPSSPDEDYATNPLDFSIKVEQNAKAMVSGVLNLSANSTDEDDIIDLDSQDVLGDVHRQVQSGRATGEVDEELEVGGQLEPD